MWCSLITGSDVVCRWCVCFLCLLIYYIFECTMESTEVALIRPHGLLSSYCINSSVPTPRKCLFIFFILHCQYLCIMNTRNKPVHFLLRYVFSEATATVWPEYRRLAKTEVIKYIACTSRGQVCQMSCGGGGGFYVSASWCSPICLNQSRRSSDLSLALPALIWNN